MKISAAEALASLVADPWKDHIIHWALDEKVATAVSEAVKRASGGGEWKTRATPLPGEDQLAYATADSPPSSTMTCPVIQSDAGHPR
jgi:hypothetical protein